MLRYFNPIGSDPDLESGIYAKEPSHVLGPARDGRRGQRDGFTITGTDHPTRDGTGMRDYMHVWDLAVPTCGPWNGSTTWSRPPGAPSVVINIGPAKG